MWQIRTEEWIIRELRIPIQVERCGSEGWKEAALTIGKADDNVKGEWATSGTGRRTLPAWDIQF